MICLYNTPNIFFRSTRDGNQSITIDLRQCDDRPGIPDYEVINGATLMVITCMRGINITFAVICSNVFHW